MKLIRQLLTKALGEQHEFSFEEKYVLSCSIFAAFLHFISIFGNVGLGLGDNTVIFVTLSFILNILIYVLGRFFNKMNLAKWMFTIFTFLICLVYWKLNYGSRGSGLYIFLLYYGSMIFIWGKQPIRIITLIVFFTVCSLGLLEYFNPDIVPLYPTEEARIMDSYIGLIMFMSYLSILVINAKNYYIHQYQMAQRSDRLKSAFLANMSHEIRTPLNAIMGFSELIAKKELTKEKKETYSQLINDNGNYLIKLISDIMDVSLIESGQLKISHERADLNELLNKIYQNFYHELKKKKNKDLQLVINIPAEKVFALTDEMRLEQILSNLLDNALKFTDAGYILFGYKIEGEFLIFYIEDTGKGIKDEFKPEIFNRFVKYEESSDRKFEGGTGIGLSLTKELVQLLGGHIWFVSEYQKGSSFYFSLPFVKDEQENNVEILNHKKIAN